METAVTGSAVAYTGGDLTYTVTSFRTNSNGDKEFMPWSMEFSTDGGMSWSKEKPEFLTLTTKEENGDLKAKTYKATFTAQVKILQTSDIILKARPEKNNVDLSMVDIHGEKLAAGQSTANCYVIHNAGTYKFPTVMVTPRKTDRQMRKPTRAARAVPISLASSSVLRVKLQGLRLRILRTHA